MDVVVTERNLGTLDEDSSFVENLLEDSKSRLSNGDNEGMLVLVSGLAEILNNQVREMAHH